jgi:hypothetical protein
MERLFKLPRMFSRIVNVLLFNGSPVESLSGRAYREDRDVLVKVIDTIYFFDQDHCMNAFLQDGRDVYGYMDRMD